MKVSPQREINDQQDQGPTTRAFAREYPFFHAAVGELNLAQSEFAAAIGAFQKAYAVARSPAERRFFQRRLQRALTAGGD